MNMWRQGWLSLAVWMAFGLALEALLAWKRPLYLLDPVRREMFRLAHSHGNLLALVLLAAALGRVHFKLELTPGAARALQLGALLMPLGFLLGGLIHPEGDPGLGVLLAPIGALLALYGVVAAAFTARRC